MLPMLTTKALCPTGHRWLINKMKELDYPADDGGMCYGVISMWLIEFFSNDLICFDDRMIYISQLPANQIQAKIFSLRVKRQESKSKLRLSEEQNLIEEIPVLFDGIMICQDTERFKAWFPHTQHDSLNSQSFDHAVPLILPKVLDLDPIRSLPSFSGIYNKPRLRMYFLTLQNAIKAAGSRHAKLGLMLSNYDHSIGVAISTKTPECFQFADPNKMPTRNISSIDHLVEEIISSFFEQWIVTFSTKIYFRQSNEKKFNPIINDWQSTQDFVEIHMDYYRAITMKDSHNRYWLHLATRSEEFAIIKELIQVGANPSIVFEVDKHFLCLAVSKGDLALVNLLLTASNVNTNEKNSRTETALSIAAKLGHLEIMQTLIANNADINQRLQDGSTPLLLAVQNKHWTAVRYLLSKNANTGLAFNTDTQFLYTFIESNEIEISHLNQFLAKSKILSGRNQNIAVAITPKDMAWLLEDINLYTLLNDFDELKYLENVEQPDKNEEARLEGLKQFFAYCLDMIVDNQEVINALHSCQIEINKHSHKRKVTMINTEQSGQKFFKNIDLSKVNTQPSHKTFCAQ